MAHPTGLSWALAQSSRLPPHSPDQLPRDSGEIINAPAQTPGCLFPDAATELKNTGPPVSGLPEPSVAERLSPRFFAE